MSMQSYPEYGFGLVLCGNEINDLAEHMQCDVYELAYLIDEDQCRTYTDEEEGKVFIPADTNAGRSAEGEDMFVIWTRKQPDIFEAAYKNIDDAVREIRMLYGKHFPVGFDYRAHMGYFQCCVYA